MAGWTGFWSSYVSKKESFSWEKVILKVILQMSVITDSIMKDWMAIWNIFFLLWGGSLSFLHTKGIIQKRAELVNANDWELMLINKLNNPLYRWYMACKEEDIVPLKKNLLYFTSLYQQTSRNFTTNDKDLSTIAPGTWRYMPTLFSVIKNQQYSPLSLIKGIQTNIPAWCRMYWNNLQGCKIQNARCYTTHLHTPSL